MTPSTDLESLARPLFAALCHQLPDRSFWMAGSPLPVCARCAGFWAGCLIATMALGFARPRPTRAWRIVHGLLVFQGAVLALPAADFGPFVRMVSGGLTACGILALLWLPVLAARSGHSGPGAAVEGILVAGGLGLTAGLAASGGAPGRSGLILLFMAGVAHVPLVLVAGGWWAFGASRRALPGGRGRR